MSNITRFKPGTWVCLELARHQDFCRSMEQHPNFATAISAAKKRWVLGEQFIVAQVHATVRNRDEPLVETLECPVPAAVRCKCPTCECFKCV